MNRIKKIIIPILIIAMFFCIIPKIENAAENKLKIGDINGDQVVDSRDTLKVLEHIAASTIPSINKKHSDWILTGEKFKAGDINENGIIDSIDTLRELEYIAASTITKIEQKHPDWKTYIEVKWKKEATGIKLEHTSITLEKGKLKKLNAIVLPENANNKVVTWSSSDVKVATVDGLGNIEAKNAGITIITATTQNKLSARCEIKVIENTTQTIQKSTPNQTTQEVSKTENKKEEITKTTTMTPTMIAKNITKVNIKLNTSSVPYNGKAQTIELDLIDGDKKLKNGTDYTLAYSNNINIGTATITITGRGNYIGTITRNFKIVEVIPTGINIRQTDCTIAVGTSLLLNAKILPENATNKSISWSSSDNSKAIINKNGVVKGIKPGKVTITAKTVNNKTDTCIIKVNIPAKSISLNKNTIKINKGNTEKLVVSFNPTNTTAKTITWASSNSNTASVNSNGIITAKAKGTATITATSKYGLTAKCIVTVTENQLIENKKITINGKTITKGQYANFRNVCTGNIATGVLYRCINPILPYSSKEKERAYYADRLLEAHKVIIVLSLSDSLSSIKSNGYSKATYYKKLLKSGKVYVYKFKDDGTYGTTEKKKIIVEGLRVIIKNKGPYAIHCKWGQGRTGFVVMLLECLMNGQYEYMYKDFKASFNNLNNSGANNEFSKYMKIITGKSAADKNNPKKSDWKYINFSKCAENYLKAGGMSDGEITALKNRLAGR